MSEIEGTLNVLRVENHLITDSFAFNVNLIVNGLSYLAAVGNARSRQVEITALKTQVNGLHCFYFVFVVVIHAKPVLMLAFVQFRLSISNLRIPILL